jgi:hypothetical protein
MTRNYLSILLIAYTNSIDLYKRYKPLAKATDIITSSVKLNQGVSTSLAEINITAENTIRNTKLKTIPPTITPLLSIQHLAVEAILFSREIVKDFTPEDLSPNTHQSSPHLECELFVILEGISPDIRVVSSIPVDKHK